MMEYQGGTMNESHHNHRVQREAKLCRLCNHPDCDVDIVQCGCSFHARCLPKKIFARSPVQHHQGIVTKEQKCQATCPSCAQPIKGIYLYPLNVDGLERASACNKKSLHETSKKNKVSLKGANEMHTDSCVSVTSEGSTTSGQVRKRSQTSPTQGQDPDSDSAATIAAATAPYLVWSKTTIECSDNDKLHFRTGRWNSSETDYVECLTRKFDRGTLNLPHGIKLNEFLRDMLMCKSSRLTKKFKNAKLSTKLYQGPRILAGVAGEESESAPECAEFARLQESFLSSVSEVTRLILKFNMNRMWRQHLFNSCLQLGYDLLDTGDWLKGLDDFEKKIADSEESLKRVRRRRMEIAFRQDSISLKDRENTGVYLKVSTTKKRSNSVVAPLASEPSTAQKEASSYMFGFEEIPVLAPILPQQVQTGSPFEPTPIARFKPNPFSVHSATERAPTISAPDPTPIEQLTISVNPSHTQYMPSPGVISPVTSGAEKNDDFSIDFLEGLSEHGGIHLYDGVSDSESSEDSMSPLLSKLTSILQKTKLPFHAVDAWMPCGVPNDHCINMNFEKIGLASDDKIRMVHGGSETRSDLLPKTKDQLNEFGAYSRKFVFDNGAGMPGRVYSSSRYSWERKVQEALPEHFRRVGGAKMCNIHTVVGIPVKYSNTDTVVIGFYSLLDLEEDENMARTLLSHCHQLEPDQKQSPFMDVPSSVETIMSNVVSRGSLHDSRTRLHSNSTESISSHASDLSSAMSIKKNMEQLNTSDIFSMANLLAAYMPIQNNNLPGEMNESLPLDKFISLRLLLLRYPTGCTEEQKHHLIILKRSYDGYMKVMMNKFDIANMLVKDWGHLIENTTQSSPWGSSMTHIDYSMKGSPKVSPGGHSMNTQGTSQPSSNLVLPPPAVASSAQGFTYVNSKSRSISMNYDPDHVNSS